MKRLIALFCLTLGLLCGCAETDAPSEAPQETPAVSTPAPTPAPVPAVKHKREENNSDEYILSNGPELFMSYDQVMAIMGEPLEITETMRTDSAVNEGKYILKFIYTDVKARRDKKTQGL